VLQVAELVVCELRLGLGDLGLDRLRLGGDGRQLGIALRQQRCCACNA
jgi:hypothetical protein